ncbi:indoleacetamide hydrolase [Actinomycetospora corticicola]|uniref:Mandelamide amidase n=1 Tax=Actinomycetospora corticicola TaxID=663602 RepID=A0A7Y9E262_9PSEU|nr:amidase family protein [Actinomycetospora corticicola]NYD39776.1 mandelamide amidase [Actinomycetospora corticicola]
MSAPTSISQVRARVAASSAAAVIEESLDAARRSDDLGVFLAVAEDIRTGTDGPLAGIPVAVKDNLDTHDLPTTGGTPALRRSRPERDHPAVAALRAAGAAVIGKTNLHELALGITSNNTAFGPARHPQDPSRSPGGSSGGSAVAVATGIVPIALGTDTGGSLRVPAAHCGIVGWRPTVGRWGDGNAVPISHTRDTAGVLTSSVADAALVDTIVTGIATGTLPARALRLGVPRPGFFDDLHPEVASVVARALDRLADAGVELVETAVPDAHALDAECGFPIVFHEIVRDLPAYLATLPWPERDLTFADVLAQIASPDVRAGCEFAASGSVTDEVYREALGARDRLRAAYAGALADVDALVYPTVPLPAIPLGDDDTTEHNGRPVPTFLTTIRNTGPGSTAGMPAISLPAGTTTDGLPIGLSLEAGPGDDALLLALAGEVERLLA